MYEKLANSPRLLMEVGLRPVQGERFQPTGFADIGHALYRLPDGTPMLLVETAQSMANRLESTCLGPDGEMIPELSGLPYIRVKLTGGHEAVTNSLVEAHRINSPFIISDKGFQQKFKEAAGYEAGKPISWPTVARALFRYDLNSLLHGVFLANLEDGRLRVPRALTAFIEARNAREAVSGGVKNSYFDPSGTIRVVDFDKDVYGNVPYHRIEYTAESLTAYFNLDLSLLRSFALGDSAFDLLVSLALFKIRRFLAAGTRLRTACDLAPVLADPHVTQPEDFDVPAEPRFAGSGAARNPGLRGCRPVRCKTSDGAEAGRETKEKGERG